MRIARTDTIFDKILDLRENSNYPGVSTGFSSLTPFYTVRRGNTTWITGYPSAGKSQIYFQFLCNLTSARRWRHIIYSPETGNAEDIYAELIHVLTGKTFNKIYPNYITKKDLDVVIPYVINYFKIIEPDNGDNSLAAFYDIAEGITKEFEIDTVGIDNWSDIEHDMLKRGTISEYLKFELPRFNMFAKNKNVHGFILAHPKSPIIPKGETGLPAPTMHTMEGGSLWAAKGQNIIIVHRDFENTDSITTNLIITKVKPKIVGKKGDIKLYYDVAANCYYEEIAGERIYPETLFKDYGRPKELTYEQKLSEWKNKPTGGLGSDEQVPF